MGRRLLFTSLLVVAMASPALANHDAGHVDERRLMSHGTPPWLVGHLLAPVGNIVGYLIVEPLTYVFEGVPQLFDLN